MDKTDSYQEHDMPNGVYVMEKRMGHWMVWAPDDDQAFFFDKSYDFVKMMMDAHSKELMR